jgi:exo-beta-1,3-glucanase (GH17 family)
MGRLVSEVANHLGLEVVDGIYLSANALLAVVHFLAPSTQHVKAFGDGDCSLLQGVFDFASEVSQSSICGLS